MEEKIASSRLVNIIDQKSLQNFVPKLEEYQKTNATNTPGTDAQGDSQTKRQSGADELLKGIWGNEDLDKVFSKDEQNEISKVSNESEKMHCEKLERNVEDKSVMDKYFQEDEMSQLMHEPSESFIGGCESDGQSTAFNTVVENSDAPQNSKLPKDIDKDMFEALEIEKLFANQKRKQENVKQNSAQDYDTSSTSDFDFLSLPPGKQQEVSTKYFCFNFQISIFFFFQRLISKLYKSINQ